MSLRAGALFLLVACSQAPVPERGEWTAADHTQPPSGAVGTNRAPRTERSQDPLAPALALWNVTCVSCHGRAGRGDGPAAPGPMVDFASPEWQRAHDDASIAEVIRLGRNAMPPFGETIAPEGIEALVALVRRFGGAAPEGHPTTPSPGGSQATDDVAPESGN